MFDFLKSYEPDFKITVRMPEMDDDHVCADCRSHPVAVEGDLCARCAEDHKRGYRTLTLAGRCANGAERDHGTRWHAVPIGLYKALCGVEPGRRSVGWSSHRVEGQDVTCPRCVKKLARAQAGAKEG